jgi:uncharacterized damage-inducible protein DinB
MSMPNWPRGAHTIWELVLHLIATQEVILLRIQGKNAGLNDEDFWPTIPPSTPKSWADAVDRLRQQEAQLQHAFVTFAEDRLSAPLVAGGTPAYNHFHGHIQHNAYHAGQIALLKKAAKQRPM